GRIGDGLALVERGGLGVALRGARGGRDERGAAGRDLRAGAGQPAATGQEQRPGLGEGVPGRPRVRLRGVGRVVDPVAEVGDVELASWRLTGVSDWPCESSEGMRMLCTNDSTDACRANSSVASFGAPVASIWNLDPQARSSKFGQPVLRDGSALAPSIPPGIPSPKKSDVHSYFSTPGVWYVTPWSKLTLLGARE